MQINTITYEIFLLPSHKAIVRQHEIIEQMV